MHEAYLKLASSHDFADRAHLLCTVAAAMRQILVDHARARQRVKHGGQLLRITLDSVELGTSGGLSMDEVSELLSISAKTVQRDWAMARAWLQRELAPSNQS